MDTGSDLKSFLHEYSGYTNQRINKSTVESAINEMRKALAIIGIHDYNLDDFSEANIEIFKYQENYYCANKKYRLLSLLCISLLDLGLIDIEK